MYSLKESVVKDMGVLDGCGDCNNRLHIDVGGLIAECLRVAYVCVIRDGITPLSATWALKSSSPGSVQHSAKCTTTHKEEARAP